MSTMGPEHDLFEYGIHRPSRTIYWGSVHHDAEETAWEGGTDYKSVAYLIKGLHLFEHTSHAPIIIYMNNPGGNEYHMFAAYDAIQHCESEVIGIVHGHAMSAASVILQACDTRVMRPHSHFMIHYGTWGYEGHAIDMLKSAEHSKTLNRQMEDIYLERIREKHPSFTRRAIQQRLKFDHFLDAQQTVDLGLADEVD